MGLVLEVTDGVGLLHLAVLNRSSLPLSRGGLGLARGSTAEVRTCTKGQTHHQKESAEKFSVEKCLRDYAPE